jgi:hypothetical protein
MTFYYVEANPHWKKIVSQEYINVHGLNGYFTNSEFLAIPISNKEIEKCIDHPQDLRVLYETGHFWIYDDNFEAGHLQE